MRRIISVALLVLVLGGGAWWIIYSRKQSAVITDLEEMIVAPPFSYATKPQIGYLSPNFILKNTQGEEVRLGDYLGKIVIINFWSTRSPFSTSELRNFERLLSEYRGRVVVLAINRGEEPMAIDNYLKENISPRYITFLIDSDEAIYRRYQAEAMPESFFIDHNGVIRDQKRGELTLDEMKSRLLPLFNK